MIDAAAIKIIFHDIDEHNKEEAQKAMAEIFSKFLTKPLEDDAGDTYNINKIECGYSDGDFFSVDIYLDDYNADELFLYGDSTMEEQIRKALPFLYLCYSESGMQGDHYINLDVWAAKDARGTK